jgi:hypothetical protein
VLAMRGVGHLYFELAEQTHGPVGLERLAIRPSIAPAGLDAHAATGIVMENAVMVCAVAKGSAALAECALTLVPDRPGRARRPP